MNYRYYYLYLHVYKQNIFTSNKHLILDRFRTYLSRSKLQSASRAAMLAIFPCSALSTSQKCWCLEHMQAD